MTESSVSACVRELVTSLEKETALYKTLTDIAQGIASAVGQGEFETLGALLKTREGVVAELRTVTEATDRLRRDLDGHEEVPQSMQARVVEAFKSARGALKALLDLERNNEESFKAMTGSIRAELAELVQGRRLLEAYRGTRRTAPLFMDKRQ